MYRVSQVWSGLFIMVSAISVECWEEVENASELNVMLDVSLLRLIESDVIYCVVV